MILKSICPKKYYQGNLEAVLSGEIIVNKEKL